MLGCPSYETVIYLLFYGADRRSVCRPVRCLAGMVLRSANK